MDIFKQIDHKVVTEATRLDMEMDQCHDPSDYNQLLETYRRMLDRYDLYVKPFTEDASLSSDDDDELPFDDYKAVITFENGKYGVQESRNFPKVDAVYDSIEQIRQTSLFKACLDGKYGIIDLDNMDSEVLPFEYDAIEAYQHKRFHAIVCKDGRYQYHCDGWDGIECSDWFDEIVFPRYAGWVVVRQGERYGWLDENLQFTSDQAKAHEHVLHDPFEVWRDVTEPHVATRAELDRCYQLDMALLHCPEEDKARLESQLYLLSAPLVSSHKLFPFSSGGKMGVKDYLGSPIVPAIYDEVQLVEGEMEDAGFGRLGDRWGLVAGCGEKVDSPLIAFDEPFHYTYESEWTIVKKDGKYGVYDIFKKRFLLDPLYDELIETAGFYHLIPRIGDRYGFFNEEFCIAPQFEQYHLGRSLSFIRFMLDGRWGFIDKDGAWTEQIDEARAYVCNPKYFIRD